MILWIRNWWWAQQRKTDMKVLWPVCKDQTHSLEQARAVFALHALNDPAWRQHYGGDGLMDFIDTLE